ncbi:LSU ribosomal protein L31p [Dehalococcoides mccartyi]|uniref:50S ribosomal protein L31 n=1 Tax=Dehalococcoides mccartyi TaxID=61435 RepID=A0A328ENU5_9CHLR|nr:LSU ribosomal protein L31p [Dehalococcoides mccartyi]
MKEKIHPKYNTATNVSCACGNTFTVGSTKDNIKVELCAQCHPFYTGEKEWLIPPDGWRNSASATAAKPKQAPVKKVIIKGAVLKAAPFCL